MILYRRKVFMFVKKLYFIGVMSVVLIVGD